MMIATKLNLNVQQSVVLTRPKRRLKRVLLTLRLQNYFSIIHSVANRTGKIHSWRATWGTVDCIQRGILLCHRGCEFYARIERFGIKANKSIWSNISSTLSFYITCQRILVNALKRTRDLFIKSDLQMRTTVAFKIRISL